VTPTQVTLQAGQTQTIRVIGTDSEGNGLANLPGIRFTSGNTAIVEILRVALRAPVIEAEVVALSAGSTTVTVSLTFQGIARTARAAITVSGTLGSSADVTATESYAFNPPTVVVARTGTVQWTFDAETHNVTFFAGPTGAPASIPDRANAQESRTFSAAGHFVYACTIHDMLGTVIVR